VNWHDSPQTVLYLYALPFSYSRMNVWPEWRSSSRSMPINNHQPTHKAAACYCKTQKSCLTQSNRGKPYSSKPTHNLKERDVPTSAIQSTHLTQCPSSQAAVHSNTGSSSAWWNNNKIAAKGKLKAKRSLSDRSHLTSNTLPGHHNMPPQRVQRMQAGGQPGGKGVEEDKGG
jgi:hypothetical protein